MKTQEGYVIHVGHHNPEEVIVAVPDKDGKPVDNSAMKLKKVNGAYLLQNRARVWARRVLPNGKLPKKDDQEVSVEVTDPQYKGDLEFLEWGDSRNGAQSIEIRHLPTSRSLDYEYQRVVQKLDTTPEQGLDFIHLSAGKNEFSYGSQELLIQMIKVHPQNRNSKSKNPDPQIKGYMYHEVTSENQDKSFVKREEASIVVGSMLMTLSTKPGALRNLLEVMMSFGVEFEVTTLSVESDIYAALLQFSKVAPGDFANYLNQFKKTIQDQFEWVKSNKALDLTKDGFISVLQNNKPTPVFEGVQGKGDGMVAWVIENILIEDVYSRLKNFKSLCDKLG
jgi:hypothetical protein